MELGMDDAIVSVVIVTWNRKTDLLDAIKSVYDQAHQCFEVIVVDNASTDGTAEMLSRSYPEVRLITLKHNTGASAGRSVGIAAAKGDFIFMLDSDASLAHDTLTKIVSKFQAEMDVGVIACKIINAFSGALDSWIFTEKNKVDQDREFLSYSFCSAGAAIRREAVEQAGVFWDKLFIYGEEDDLSLRVWDAGYKILYWPQAVIYHRESPQKRVTYGRREYFDLRNSLYIYFVRYPWWMFALFAPLQVAISLFKAFKGGYTGDVLPALSEVSRELPSLLRERRPISNRTARRYLSLQRQHGPLSWDLASWLKHKTQSKPLQSVPLLKMPKVCFVAHHSFSSDPRVQRYVNALADAGAAVDVLCLKDEAFSKVRDEVRVFTIPLHHGEGGLGRYILEYSIAMVLFTARLVALYAKNRYQLIQVHNIPDFLVFTALVPRLFGSKLILDNRDPMPEFYISRFRVHPLKTRIVRLLEFQERLSSRVADAVITANVTFKQNLVKRGVPAEKITVINNLPDPEVFSRERYKKVHRSSPKHFTLIYPGTIAPRYGLAVAVRALPLLKTKISNLRLVIIGGHTDHASELLELAKKLNVLYLVELKPPVSVDKVPERLIEADIGIYPALPDPHMSIATPTKVLEYAAMGIPIVASKLEVLEHLFDDQSIEFFEPGNVKAFTKSILNLYENQVRRDELVCNADSIFVHKHRWSEERQVYIELLNRLLTSKEQIPLV
jgi:GT2 family glycosyltransferase